VLGSLDVPKNDGCRIRSSIFSFYKRVFLSAYGKDRIGKYAKDFPRSENKNKIISFVGQKLFLELVVPKRTVESNQRFVEKSICDNK